MDVFNEIIEITSTDDRVTFDTLKNQKFVFYFYPKDDTSACTLEALGFKEMYDDFRSLGYEVYGISKDTLKSHLRFRDKYNLPFPLISDVDQVLLKLFDVIVDKKMYGKAVKGTERSTFIFNEGFKLIRTFRKVDAKSHVNEVLDYLRDLG